MSFFDTLMDLDPINLEAKIGGEDLQWLADPARGLTKKVRDASLRPQPNTPMGAPGNPAPGPETPPDTLLTALPMPSLTDSDRRTAARKAAARLRTRGGRASTILTDDALGGGL